MNVIRRGIGLGIAGGAGAWLVTAPGLWALLALPMFFLASVVVSWGERR